MKKIVFILSFLFLFSFLKAQLLTWTPDFAKDNDNITITVDATRGNQGLLGFSGDVYVHIGLITNFSSDPGNWQHVLFDWGTTPLAAKATPAGTNKWSYTINNIRSFFSVTNSNEIVKAIAILFRDGSGNKAQRNADVNLYNGNMYVPVYDNSLAVRISDPPFQPYYVPQPEPLNKTVGDNIDLSAIANKASTMKLYLNGTVIQTAANATTITASPTLVTAGNNLIVAEANDGISTKTDTLKFYVAPAINVASLPAGLRAGINYEADNTAVTLVLYAPGKNRVSIIGEFAGSNWTEQAQYQMNKTPDGNYWWIRLTGLTPGTEYAYQYLIDGNLKIADPYSEKILDPYNNNDGNISSSTYPSLKPYPTGMTTGIVGILQTTAPQYNWQVNNFTRPDKRKLVIYELLLRDFVGAHDWNTLRDTLSYLKNLGVNAIEIMPFNEFEGNDSWGYNPDFYFAPDKYYGPKNSLKRFIDSCHQKGLAVIMDIALNHSFGLSPLVQLYWDAANNRPAADNPWFNPLPTHPYNVGYDMNHESPETKYFFSRVVDHWLTNYRLDGFRFDLSKGFTQKESCDSNGNNCDVALWGQYDSSRVEIWKGYYDTLQLKSPGCYAILEHFAANNEEIDLSNYGMLLWGNMNDNYAQAAMGYSAPSPNGNTWNLEGGIYKARNWPNPYLVTYMESHDEERLMYKNLQYGNSSGNYNVKDLNTALKRIEMCGAFLFSIPGPKMLWQFGEMGYDYSINRCEDGSVSDNCRLSPKPIRWDYLQNLQRKRLHDVFADLIKLRFHPLYKDVFISDQINYSLNTGFKWLQVTTDTSQIFVLGNFDVVTQTNAITFPMAGTWYDYIDGSQLTATGGAQNITLQPGEYHIYLNRNVISSVATPVPSVNGIAGDLSVRVRPNPISMDAAIDITVPSSGMMEVDLVSITGEKLSAVYSGFLIKGPHTLNFQNDGHWAYGVYLLRIYSKRTDKTVKIILK